MSRRLIIHGGRRRRELVLVGRMVVGRDPTCDVSESDPLLSRRHAEFVAGAREVIVRDLGSRNGILVNGVKRPQAVLHGGDVVQVGHLQVRFEDETGPFHDREPADARPTVLPTVSDRSALPPPPKPPAPPAPARVGTGTERLDAAPLDEIEPTLKISPAAPDGHELFAAESMEVFFSPGNRICFEKPAAGWRAVPGGAAAVVSLLHDSGEAAVVVERVSTGPWFTPGEVNPALADREEEAIRGQDPDASCLEATLVSLGERRMVAIDYGRTGLAGPERVRQYSIPAGSGLFRLTCSATEARFASLEPVFVHVASTFATGT